MAQLPCPHCSQQLQLPDNVAGKTIRCPKCQQEFSLPVSDAVVVAESVTAKPPSVFAPTAEKLPRRTRQIDRRPIPAGSSSLLWIGLLSGLALLTCCLVGGGVSIVGIFSMRAAVAEEEAQRREEAAQAKLRRAMELQLEIRAREEAAFREEENRAAQQKEFREEQARQEAEREKARLERLRLEKALEESRLAEEAAKSHHGEFKRLKLPVATSHVRALRFTDDGKSFYAATMGEGVFSWDVATWTQRRHQLELGKFVIGTPAIGAAAISPSGDKAFFGRHGGALRWYDLTRDPAPQSTMQIDERERQFAFNHIEVSPDGRHLITCHGNSVASLWDLPKRTRIKFLTDFKDQVHAAAFMGNTGTIAVGADFARIFSPKPYRKTDLRTENSSPLTSVAFSPDERHLSGIRGNTLYHWKIAEKKPIPFLASFSGKAMHMAYSPDGKNLAVAINPTRVYFYDPETLKQQWMLDMPKSGDLGNVPNAIAFHPDNRRFAVARESTIYVFDLSNLDKGK